jgi:hypothetical protein
METKKVFAGVDGKETVLSFHIHNTEEKPDQVTVFIENANEQERRTLEFRQWMQDYMDWAESDEYNPADDEGWREYLFEEAVLYMFGQQVSW